MLTLFTIPKPFQGHIDIIQRNAIRSWLQLRPACEIILLGDDPGTADVAREYGLQHLSDVARSSSGTPLVSSIFEQAQGAADRQVMAYVNADIILLSDFPKALKHALLFDRFLMVGRRWNLDVSRLIAFDQPDWEKRLRTDVTQRGELYDHTGIDYFVFPRGMLGPVPPFAIGRTIWDNWLIYRARACGAAVIDATPSVMAIHQNHDYAHVAGGVKEIWNGSEAEENLGLAGGRARVFSLQDATHQLFPNGPKRALSLWHLRRHLDTFPMSQPRLGLPLRLCSSAINLSQRAWLRLGHIFNSGGSQRYHA